MTSFVPRTCTTQSGLRTSTNLISFSVIFSKFSAIQDLEEELIRVEKAITRQAENMVK